MTAHEQEDRARQLPDAIDCVIDESIADALDGGRVDLREKVMASLEAIETVSFGRRLSGFLLRPAFLPALGALLLVVGVATLWERADQQLSISTPRPATARLPQAGAPTAARDATPDVRPSTESRARVLPTCTQLNGPDSCGTRPRTRTRSASEARVFAASLLEMDATSSTVPGDEEGDAAGTRMPGAPAGDLGDRIAPMPALRPIVIHPIATPPIELAPPVSTLGKPVSTLADEADRDPGGPGKPGGQ